MPASRSNCARTAARNPLPIRPISPIATASTVTSTAVVSSFCRTSALAKQGSFTGPAARSVMSTFAAPARSSPPCIVVSETSKKVVRKRKFFMVFAQELTSNRMGVDLICCCRRTRLVSRGRYSESMSALALSSIFSLRANAARICEAVTPANGCGIDRRRLIRFASRVNHVGSACTRCPRKRDLGGGLQAAIGVNPVPVRGRGSAKRVRICDAARHAEGHRSARDPAARWVLVRRMLSELFGVMAPRRRAPMRCQVHRRDGGRVRPLIGSDPEPKRSNV